MQHDETEQAKYKAIHRLQTTVWQWLHWYFYLRPTCCRITTSSSSWWRWRHRINACFSHLTTSSAPLSVLSLSTKHWSMLSPSYNKQIIYRVYMYKTHAIVIQSLSLSLLLRVIKNYYASSNFCLNWPMRQIWKLITVKWLWGVDRMVPE